MVFRALDFRSDGPVRRSHLSRRNDLGPEKRPLESRVSSCLLAGYLSKAAARLLSNGLPVWGRTVSTVRHLAPPPHVFPLIGPPGRELPARQKVRLIQNSVLATTIFAVSASNIYWQWANDYLACLLAIIAAGIVGLCFEKFVNHRSYRQMRREFGKDWR